MTRYCVLLAVVTVTAFGATPSISDTGVPVTTVVTVQAKGDTIPAALTRDDILVSQDNHRVPVTDTAPVRDLQLWVLIDDGSDKDLALQFNSLRSFIRQQSPATQIGIGYIQHGSVQATQPLTTDHERAANALRIPMGPPGISASPYLALSDLIKHWQSGGEAREVLLISSGIDPDYGPGPENPYLMSAIETAQHGGVIIHALFYRGPGAFGRGGNFWGQNNLAQVSEETAGAFYWEGNRNPVSIEPYLEALNRRLNAQYVVTFMANGRAKPGMQNIKVSTDIPGTKVIALPRVFVPAS